MTVAQVREMVWKIDNIPGILNYRLRNGVSIWLTVRYSFYRTLADKQFASPATIQKRTTLKQKWRSQRMRAAYWRQSYIHRPALVKEKYECVNFCSTSATIKNGEGAWSSKITGFVDNIPNLATLHAISSRHSEYRLPYAGTWCLQDYLVLKQQLLQKTGKATKKQDPTIKSFFELLTDESEGMFDTAHRDELEGQANAHNNLVAGFEKDLRHFFEQTKPGLLLLEDANYGGWTLCTILKLAHDMNITTAEIQHGIFDIAFQYGKGLLKDPLLKMQKTRYLLTFGEYFTKYVQSVSTNISIGSYYLEQKKKTGKPIIHEKPVILFVSQIHYTYPLIPLLKEALENFNGAFELIIRLHPSELDHKEPYSPLTGFPGTVFSTREDLYDLLQEASYVIGLFSTVMFECIYFDKMPLVFKNELSDEFLPATMGKRFSNGQELLQLLNEKENRQSAREQKELFWAPDCELNFTKFIREHIRPAAIHERNI